MQYCIKWEGYPDEDNTWEYEENVFCKDLIKDFEDSQSKPSPPRKKSLSSRKTLSPSGSKSADNSKLKENTLQPGKWDSYVASVLNVEKGEDGELMIYLKWHDGDETCHASKIANINCPQRILQFYEDHLKFKDESA